MTATREDISGWLQCGKKADSTHLIIVCDTYDHDDYPVFVSSDENVHEIENHYRESSMQTVMEVYNLSIDFETQLNERRAFNY